jgi:hypothetical protein
VEGKKLRLSDVAILEQTDIVAYFGEGRKEVDGDDEGYWLFASCADATEQMDAVT